MKAGPELAWRQLVKQKGHFSAALAGVAFAVTLMLGQIGLRDSLLETGIRLYKHMRADIVMTSWEYQYQEGSSVIPRRRLSQTLAVDGVAQCIPLQIGWLAVENPDNHENHEIVMLGFDPHANLWNFGDQKVNFAPLTERGTMIYDEKSRDIYGPLPALFRKQGRLPVTAQHRSLDIIDMIQLGPGFANHGTVFVSDSTYGMLARLGPLPTVGAITLKPGADPDVVLNTLRASLPGDVKFSLFQTFLETEKHYWLTISPIGFVFTAGLLLGVVVGSVVVYQILYSDVTNHLAEYATMKAMGYTNSQLFRLVILQAVFMSLLGFVPGALMAKGIYVVTHNATQLPMEMTVDRLTEVYLMTLIMCVLSALLAMLALRSADPAEIF